MKRHFKDAQVETDQPIVFESDQVEFRISTPSGNWKITRLNSPVVSASNNQMMGDDEFLYSGEEGRR